MEVRQVRLEKGHFGKVARPEDEGQGNFVAAAVLNREDLAIRTVPELVFVHGIGYL